MNKKENNNKVKYTILLIIILGIIFFFRVRIVDFYASHNLKFSYFKNNNLSLSERDEYELLKSQNKILETENNKLKEQLTIQDSNTGQTPVELLLTSSNLYGDFYVSLPKNITTYIGMNIYSEGNVLVGTVEQIFPNSMRVTNLGQKKGVIASDLASEEFLELRSLSNGLYVGSVPGGSKIEVGSQIILKGYPTAIIGTVVEIQKSDNAQARVFVRTPYNVINKSFYYVLQ